MQYDSGEQIIVTKAANLRRNMEYAGGKLTVTSKRLRFDPHIININSKPLEIDLSDVAGVEPRRLLGIIPTSVVITLKDRSEVRLIVWGRGKLIEAIREHSRVLRR